MKTQLQRIYNEGDLRKLKALKSLLKALDPAEEKRNPGGPPDPEDR
jgi:hypothetical protein